MRRFSDKKRGVNALTLIVLGVALFGVAPRKAKATAELETRLRAALQ